MRFLVDYSNWRKNKLLNLLETKEKNLDLISTIFFEKKKKKFICKKLNITAEY